MGNKHDDHMNHPRKKKHIRADHKNQLILKAKARLLRAAMENVVLEAYIDDSLRGQICPYLTMDEIVDRTELVQDATLKAVMFLRCHKYMKDALRNAITIGDVPGVLVNEHFCEDVSIKDYESTTDPDILRSWLAGAGRGNKAAGILFIYDDDKTAQRLYDMTIGGVLRVAVGVIKRAVHSITAGAAQSLPDMKERARRIEKKGVPDVVKLLGSKSAD